MINIDEIVLVVIDHLNDSAPPPDGPPTILLFAFPSLRILLVLGHSDPIY